MFRCPGHFIDVEGPDGDGGGHAKKIAPEIRAARIGVGVRVYPRISSKCVVVNLVMHLAYHHTLMREDSVSLSLCRPVRRKLAAVCTQVCAHHLKLPLGRKRIIIIIIVVVQLFELWTHASLERVQGCGRQDGSEASEAGFFLAQPHFGDS